MAEEMEIHIKAIHNMNYEDMMRLVRFAPSGHVYFVSGTPLSEVFNARLEYLRSITSPEDRVRASKRIGWG